MFGEGWSSCWLWYTGVHCLILCDVYVSRRGVAKEAK